VKVKVNQTSPTLWGKLGIVETRVAAERLSGDAFKAWILLALNQDGYVWCGDLEPRTFQELADYGYLLPLEGGNYVFLPDGETEGYDIPAEWGKIAGLYGSSGQKDLSYVRDKLKTACLGDRLGDILSYWGEKYEAIQEIDHSKVRNRLKFDLSIVLTWWLWSDFRFEVGDRLEVGQGAKRLRFHDTAFQEKTQRESNNRGMAVAYIQEKNVDYWNNAFSAQKFEIPLDVVGNILKSRNHCSESSSG